MPSARHAPVYLAIFFALFACALITLHLHLLTLPFFWDELGQFVPTALDLLRTGAWVAHSAIPNVHPPGVEAYLVVWYKLFGYSIPITRLAMLLLASAGLLLTFLLAIELSRGSSGAPALLPPLLLLISPLFYMQSMMAQLDMPAMVFTLLALLLFCKRMYGWAAVASVMLVLAKETGLVIPAVFALQLALQKDWKRASFFAAPAMALALWLIVLHRATGFWLGDPGFAHYNVGYSLHPVRIVFSLLRRIYYLFFAEFRFIGTAVLLFTWRGCKALHTPAWKTVLLASTATTILVSVLGGAELERYLLPVLPVFYIAVAVALTTVRIGVAGPATVLLAAGLIANTFWNPPYSFPFEDNYAMVDFVRLQQAGGQFAEQHFTGKTIATAWPYSAALRRPDYGFVHEKLKVLETGDFHTSSIRALPPDRFDVLITYTRSWNPSSGLMSIPGVKAFLGRYYDWQADITEEQCAALGLKQTASWSLRGQQIDFYVRQN